MDVKETGQQLHNYLCTVTFHENWNYIYSLPFMRYIYVPWCIYLYQNTLCIIVVTHAVTLAAAMLIYAATVIYCMKPSKIKAK